MLEKTRAAISRSVSLFERYIGFMSLGSRKDPSRYVPPDFGAGTVWRMMKDPRSVEPEPRNTRRRAISKNNSRREKSRGRYSTRRIMFRSFVGVLVRDESATSV